LWLYLNIHGLRKGLGKCFMGSRKVLEFFVTKRVGKLNKNDKAHCFFAELRLQSSSEKFASMIKNIGNFVTLP